MHLNHSLLENYHYPQKEFEKLIASYRRGELNENNNIIKGDISLPSSEHFMSLPEKSSEKYKNYFNLGMESIKKGELAVAVLNGGMATRFGGVVKGVVEVLDSKSFLELKIEKAFHISSAINVYIMNSFSTENKTKKYFKEKNYFGRKENIKFFNQFIAPRITPEGEIYKEGKEKVSFYGPGHGDFPYAFKKSGMLDEFLLSGGKYVFLSNVDNLGASLDPALLGMHISSRKQLSAEVAQKESADEGGAPVFVDGRLQLLESFSFPDDIDRSRIPVFNCNSYWINAEGLKESFDLPWYMVKKQVNGDTVIQFEHICGDLTRFLDTGFIKVRREKRFMPVKRPEDLEKVRKKLK
ncbi:MAG: UTP--glucose-1-phosphate uridylyltransferase [Elusimicrobiota bacterium]